MFAYQMLICRLPFPLVRLKTELPNASSIAGVTNGDGPLSHFVRTPVVATGFLPSFVVDMGVGSTFVANMMILWSSAVDVVLLCEQRWSLHF